MYSSLYIEIYILSYDRTKYVCNYGSIKNVLCQDILCEKGGMMARIIDGEKMNLIGDNVRFYRKKRKMSQQALSNKLELMGVYICRGSVSRIEDKSRTVTDIELYAISQILGVSMEELVCNRSAQ